MEKTELKKRKGFSLIEVVVAVFIFVLVITASSGTFVNAIKGYRNAKIIQRNMENAQQSMNIMAKTLRTSSVVSCNDGGGSWNNDCSAVAPVKQIRIYDYSQGSAEGACIEYGLSGNDLMFNLGKGAMHTLVKCESATPALVSQGNLIEGVASDINFDVIQSTLTGGGTVGKVTISMEVCSTAGCGGTEEGQVRIQSSVSSRDYNKSGL